MPRTFFIDIDGTIVKHLSDEELDLILKEKTKDEFREELLPGVSHFFKSLNKDDTVIFTTARMEEHRQITEEMLKHNGIHYSQLIMGLSCGPRYLINDTVNCLYQKSIAINVLRDTGFGDISIFDPDF
jgi:bisphosphoglycerate-independent phosphoglycerate mutase (AlkP superfamily)